MHVISYPHHQFIKPDDLKHIMHKVEAQQQSLSFIKTWQPTILCIKSQYKQEKSHSKAITNNIMDYCTVRRLAKLCHLEQNHQTVKHKDGMFYTNVNEVKSQTHHHHEVKLPRYGFTSTKVSILSDP
jgi:endonuclease/exonuclease/phosphatase (EEP) superfamily protein YafD